MQRGMRAGKDHPLVMLTRYLETRGIPYCLVGDTGGFPSVIGGDVDIIISQERIETIHSVVLSFAGDHKLRVVQCLQHENNAFYYVLQWFEDGILKFLKVDICGDFYRKARLFLTASELLSKVMEAVDDQGNLKGFFIADPATEFIYYLLKKIDKGKIENRHAFHLHDQWKKDPEGCREKMRRFWKGADCDLIAAAVAANDWALVIEAIPSLRRALRRNARCTRGGIGGELRRRIRRILFPAGLTVAVLGPDGSGKSSVIKAVTEALSPAFRKNAMYHLRPFLLRVRPRSDEQVVTNPHASKPYGTVVSLMKLAYLWLDYTLGYAVLIRWKKVHSTLVLFDRYYHDLVVDSRRFRYGGPLRMARLVGKIIPLPDIFIVLHASAYVIRARKKEVTPDECVRQNGEYVRLAKTMRKALIVDTGQPLTDVVKEVNTFLLDYMAHRTERRLLKMARKAPIG